MDKLILLRHPTIYIYIYEEINKTKYFKFISLSHYFNKNFYHCSSNNFSLCYKTRSCLDLKKQKERKEEKKKETEVNTSSSQLKMKS